MDPAIVQAVERRARVIFLQAPGKTGTHRYAVDQGASQLNRIIAGDEVQATLAKELTVYVSLDGRIPGDEGAPRAVVPDARVLSVDPSYRLLTVQYPDGRTETFKVAREVKLKEMEAGDDVMIQTHDVVSLALRKRSHGRE
jgi:hypothetical protein